jgi:hypothetical protein
MRFAGTRMEGFLNNDAPKFGELTQKSYANRIAEETAGTELMGKTAATGISEAGKVEAAGIVGAANASLASAQGNAAMMEGIGGIASSAMGAFGGGGGGGSSSFGSPVVTSGIDYSSAFSNPNFYSI